MKNNDRPWGTKKKKKETELQFLRTLFNRHYELFDK